MPERPLDGITLKSLIVDGRTTGEPRARQRCVEQSLRGADCR
jgi:hypothetical protein